jgi:hypothetical protein
MIAWVLRPSLSAGGIRYRGMFDSRRLLDLAGVAAIVEHLWSQTIRRRDETRLRCT